ncbi:rod shape-determining protein MreD [Streptacidiphilus sp. PB12-B1b]|uniref:rod shape-determining protein MreD n=1 Tax=Streptacidiphilus sp. PB12-B1b TaxID=2705012 RepID=UPI0015FD30F7|nr:rod shape-determining protein MreD [Streptacidiphilus sp. PB12-B1b]QMU75530.1 rod shape-determining protein MreD [Streptacidiphilus sp. PB12-B1b]
MWLNRILLSTALIVVGLVVQVSVLARLGLPGAVPDLLMLEVIGLSLVYGPVGGSLVGFGTGLLVDIAPPSDHAVGRYALVLCLLGYAVGLLRSDGGYIRSVATPLLVVAAAAFSTTLLYALVGVLVGDAPARHVGLPGLLVTSVLYDVLLAPFVVPGVVALARRTVREPVGNGGTGLGGRRRLQRSSLDRRGSFFGGGGSRSGGEAGLGTVPGFGPGGERRWARKSTARL